MFTESHDRAFAESLFDLRESDFDRFVLFVSLFFVCHMKGPSLFVRTPTRDRRDRPEHCCFSCARDYQAQSEPTVVTVQ
jgi:hypothetical protein